MSRGRELQVCTGRVELSAAVARCAAQAAARATAERGRFTIALPGGSALALLARGLAGGAEQAAVDWSAWQVFWVDERCVPAAGPDSNFGAADREFLSKVPIPRGQIHAVDGAAGSAVAARTYGSDLAEFFQSKPGETPRFDLVLLGMGEDGHVASLFPSHPALAERRQWVVPVLDAPKPPPERITLTLPVINNARCILLVAAGAGKAAALARIWSSDSRGPVLPAGLVRPAAGEMRWMLDSQAAANLPDNISRPIPSAKEIP
jgi:6-phosphogluconolactonase